MHLIQIEPGNGPGTVTVVWEGDPSVVETTQHRTILDGTSYPAVCPGFHWDGSTFTAPAGWVAPASQAPATVVMKAVLWYNCFTPAEAVAIKKSQDPLVMEFLYRLNQQITAGETIDTARASVQDGVNYLASTNQIPEVTPAAPYLAAARVQQILAGVMP